MKVIRNISLNKNFLKGEAAAFGNYLNEQAFLSASTRELYNKVIQGYLIKHKQLTPEGAKKYLVKRPRQYVRSALMYYSAYRGQAFDLPKVREPACKPQPELSIKQAKSLVASLQQELRRCRVSVEVENDMVLCCELRLWTSMRIRESLRVRRMDIDFEKGVVSFRKKGGSFGRNYIPVDFAKKLYTYAQEVKGLLEAEEIFFTKSRNAESKYRLYRYYVSSCVRNPEEKALLLKTHSIRACVINEICKQPDGLFLANQIANHQSIGTTMRYINKRVKEEGSIRAYEEIKKVIQ